MIVIHHQSAYVPLHPNPLCASVPLWFNQKEVTRQR